MKNTLFTGGSGLLGGAMRKTAPDFLYPSSQEFNVTDYHAMEEYLGHCDVDVIIHAAAVTSPPRVDSSPIEALAANIVGTANMVTVCSARNIRLIYISTDYVFKGDRGHYAEDDEVFPVNRYAWSKLGGECTVRMYDKALIVRTSFGPTPFPYPKAFVDQWTSRETVMTIANKLIPLVDSDLTGVIHLGGKRQTVYEYAIHKAGGEKIGELRTDQVSFTVPKDTSLNCDLYKQVFA